MKDNRYSLRALALLLGYPDVALRAQLPALMDVLDQEGSVPAARRADWAPLPPLYPRGVLAEYAKLVHSASEGAVTG